MPRSCSAPCGQAPSRLSPLILPSFTPANSGGDDLFKSRSRNTPALFGDFKSYRLSADKDTALLRPLPQAPSPTGSGKGGRGRPRDVWAEGGTLLPSSPSAAATGLQVASVTLPLPGATSCPWPQRCSGCPATPVTH